LSIVLTTVPSAALTTNHYSDDGAHAYLASQGRQPPFITVTDAKTHTVAKQIGPFSDVVRPFTINGKQTFAFASG